MQISYFEFVFENCTLNLSECTILGSGEYETNILNAQVIKSQYYKWQYGGTISFKNITVLSVISIKNLESVNIKWHEQLKGDLAHSTLFVFSVFFIEAWILRITLSQFAISRKMIWAFT